MFLFRRYESRSIKFRILTKSNTIFDWFVQTQHKIVRQSVEARGQLFSFGMPEIWKKKTSIRTHSTNEFIRDVIESHQKICMSKRKLSKIFGICLHNSEHWNKHTQIYPAWRKITSLCVRAQNVNKMFAFYHIFFFCSLSSIYRFLTSLRKTKKKTKAIYSNQIELSANWLF